MNEALVETLLQGLASVEPEVRDRAADEVTDVHHGLSDDQVSALVSGLVAALLRETVPNCQEAQLHALCDMQVWHHLDAQALQPLSGVRGRLQRAHLEYLDDLISGRLDS